jgi:SAM-dependent methyltransferase
VAGRQININVFKKLKSNAALGGHIISMLKKWTQLAFAHPLVQKKNDLDSPATTVLRRQIIQEKLFLKNLYSECYQFMAQALPKHIAGPIVELGSGAGFVKEYIPDCLTSEIIKIPDIDLILDGAHLPFPTGALKGIVMFDVLHHIPDAAPFFSNAAECIKPGGVIVMIEPWSTPWSRFVYRYLHHEPFVPDVKEWSFPIGGPLSQANSALPWIIFERDREKFEKDFPQYQVREVMLDFPFCYLLSGGVSFRSLVPGYTYNIIRKIENLSQPWMNSLAMFAKIILVRRASI